MEKNVLKLFNCLINPRAAAAGFFNRTDISMISYGVVTNFSLSPEQTKIISENFPMLPIRTLFGRAERVNGEFHDLLHKQILHYVEVNVLNVPGLFDLEVESGVIIKPTFVKGITVSELAEKVQTILYTNAPVKSDDLVMIKELILHYDLPYDFDKITNNELRIMMYDPNKNKLANGDEAIRYMVYVATENTLVIKNKVVIGKIKAAKIPTSFFEKNDYILSQVFNRFKPLILAAKNISTRTAINKITRMSKVNHKRVYESVSKRFLSLMIKSYDQSEMFEQVVGNLTTRDKFKILNLIEYKLLGLTTDAFVIRNGTVHIERNRKVIDKSALTSTLFRVIDSLSDDLKHLRGKKILLDSRVDYGLPISRKQTLGNLPFGTTVLVEGNISSGIYWRNEWGARDLDLSTIDMNGTRTGWASYRGYVDSDIIFSGDITDAYDGAMEFMTSTDQNYGLFVNIFNGDDQSGFEIVVGSQSSNNKWIDDVVIREKSNLTGKGSIVGFVKKNKFVVFQGKLNDNIANFGESNPVINRAAAPMWTVARLFNNIGIAFDTEPKEENYDYNLTYSEFSLDKLEEMI